MLTEIAPPTLDERVAALEARLAALEARPLEAPLPDACRRRTCSYFRDYLAQGPAELVHEAFHEVEREALALQGTCHPWHDAHPDAPDQHCPGCGSGRLDRLERRIRA